MLSLDLAEAAGAGVEAVAGVGVAGVVWPNAKAEMAIPIGTTSALDAGFTWHLHCGVMDFSTLTLAAMTNRSDMVEIEEKMTAQCCNA
jgi:hypothetical protein